MKIFKICLLLNIIIFSILIGSPQESLGSTINTNKVLDNTDKVLEKNNKDDENTEKWIKYIAAKDDENTEKWIKYIATNNNNIISISISVIAIILSVFSLYLTSVRLNLFTKQVKFNSLIEILKINREIIGLGIQKPEMLYALNPELEKDFNTESKENKLIIEYKNKYLQLWFNQAQIAWQAYEMKLYSEDSWDAFKKDLKNLFRKENHFINDRWKEVNKFYSDQFNDFIDKEIIEKEKDSF